MLFVFFYLFLQKQTIRVVVQQGTVTMASYMSEQLELDMKRNELVASGKLSQEEADDDAEEWEQVRFLFVSSIPSYKTKYMHFFPILYFTRFF